MQAHVPVTVPLRDSDSTEGSKAFYAVLFSPKIEFFKHMNLPGHSSVSGFHRISHMNVSFINNYMCIRFGDIPAQF